MGVGRVTYVQTNTTNWLRLQQGKGKNVGFRPEGTRLQKAEKIIGESKMGRLKQNKRPRRLGDVDYAQCKRGIGPALPKKTENLGLKRGGGKCGGSTVTLCFSGDKTHREGS